MNTNAERIKEAVSMREIAEMYGMEVNRAGYMLCPLHGENTPSFRVYENGWYCFGCASGGDVIKFIQLYFDINFNAAVARLNYDFNLCLPLGERMSAQQRARMRQEARTRKEQSLVRQAEAEAKEREYWALWGEWMRLDKNKRAYAPKHPEEALHPLFLEACQKIEMQSHLIDCLT